MSDLLVARYQGLQVLGGKLGVLRDATLALQANRLIYGEC